MDEGLFIQLEQLFQRRTSAKRVSVQFIYRDLRTGKLVQDSLVLSKMIAPDKLINTLERVIIESERSREKSDK